MGTVVLVAAQALVGVIHAAFGLWLFSASPTIYSAYTVAFGVFTLVFAWGLWQKRRWGWIGTVAVAAFVIVTDILTLLDLPSVPGIPRFAGAGEIPYSLLVIGYIARKQIKNRRKRV
jgi:uncharacterized membrane protein (DUF2068 family)